VSQDEYILIIYDRQYLDASHDEVMTLIEVEMPKFQPSPNSIDGNSSQHPNKLYYEFGTHFESRYFCLAICACKVFSCKIKYVKAF
jgi:hypothetical protein